MTFIFSKIYKKWQIFGDARAPLEKESPATMCCIGVNASWFAA
jgi:hypothetical protein